MAQKTEAKRLLKLYDAQEALEEVCPAAMYIYIFYMHTLLSSINVPRMTLNMEPIERSKGQRAQRKGR
jgi:hypothetical protein